MAADLAHRTNPGNTYISTYLHFDGHSLDLIENASDAIYVHDVHGRFMFVNRKAEEITGYRRSQLLNKHIRTILAGDAERLIRSKLRSHKSLRWDQKFEISIKSRSGKLIPVELSMAPIVENRKLIGFEGIARDISERKETEVQLQQRDSQIHQLNLEIQKKNMQLEEIARLQSEFVSNISHEFRTPLNAIMGYTELLAERSYGTISEQQSEVLSNIKRSASDLLKMVQDVIDWSKLKSNQLDLERHLCSPNDLVEATAGTIRSIAASKGLEVHCESSPDLPAVNIDFRRIYEAFVSLAGNAVKFTEKGHIRISAERENGAIRFSVSDTGIGISTQMQKEIFNAFTQVDGSNKRPHGGLGLGLSLSKRLIELHEGTLGVASRRNHGSTFYFLLPIAV